MKKHLLKLMIAPLMGAFIMAGTSCKKEGCTDVDAINYDEDAKDDDGSCVYPASVQLNFEPMVGSQTFAFNTEYTVNGRKVMFERAQFYVSSFGFMKGGGYESLPNAYLLVHPGQTSYQLTGELAAGTYSGIKFAVGVDSLTNSTVEPESWPAGHALSVNNPNYTYWSWSSGYVFIRLEGKVDTTLAANGTPNYPFVFHVGTNGMLRTVNLSKTFTVEDGDNVSFDVHVDYAEMLAGIDLRTENETHTMNDMPTASAVANNATNAFHLH